ncbi:hypothetical protein [Actinoplanes subglobosus]|uniref:Uncharacterized protein n=1 Tax=Actinoplanes subglobosus TaxID=1547892 RepID=A0ABV8IZ95_9ACTN
MRFRPAPAVTASVLTDGCLELIREVEVHRFRCGPAGTAMWIALGQYDGDRVTAAGKLAIMWDKDLDLVLAEMDKWISELCDASLLHPEP